MKFFLLLWTLLVAVVSSDDMMQPCGKYQCPLGDIMLRDATCSGFKVRKESAWDDYGVNQNGTCVMAEDADMFDFNSNFLCCAENDDDCCEDYPTGFYVAFGIGVGGIAAMILYAVYLCFGSSSDPKVEG